MMDFKLGEQVSLKLHVAESLLDDACASVERKSGNSYRAKVIPANPAACWHNHCGYCASSKTAAYCWRTPAGTSGKQTGIPS